MSFLKMSKRVGSITKFMENNANVDTLKYRAEVGAKHLIYFPFHYILDENGVPEKDENGNNIKELEAISASIHSWNTPDGKFHSTVCTKGNVVTDDAGNILFDGSCPFCDRLGDAWDIYNYRKELEERTCGKVGKDLEEHLKNLKLANDNKVKKAENFMYILVAQINMDEKSNPVIGQDGIPSYSLKIMRLSESQLAKIQSAADTSDDGSEIPDREVIISYPANSSADKNTALMQSSKDRTITFRGNHVKLTTKYPALLERINDDVAKWTWEGIEKSFREFEETSAISRKAVVDAMFEEWDAYKIAKESNPDAKYLEYNKVQADKAPQINGVQMPSLGTSDAFADAPKMNKDIPQMGDLGGDLGI